MSRLLDPDARIRAFLDEGRTELSDRAYDTVRTGIDRTRQRIVIGPLAEPRIPSIATFAIAAAAVLIVGAIGLASSPSGRRASRPARRRNGSQRSPANGPTTLRSRSPSNGNREMMVPTTGEP